MAKGKITKRTVDALVSNGADEYLWDSDLKGFAIKATANGTKTYLVQYRIGGRDAQTKRYTIGKHGTWTPEKARTEAEEVLSIAGKGTDPHQRKVDKHRELLQTDFENVVAEFIEKYAKPRNRSWREVERIFNHDIIPAFRGKSLLSISRRDIVSLIDSVAERGEVLANHVFARLRKLFNWAVERGIMETSPMAGMRVPFAEGKRERVLNDAEIKLVWNSVAKLEWPFAPWAQLLILTGQRRNEVASMRWQDVDLKKGIWTIPSEIAKNGNTHEVPLCDEAINILKELPRMNSGYVFTTNLKTSISGFSRAKRRTDAIIMEALEQAAKELGLRKSEKIKPMPQWCWHDLRRTVATGMASMSCPPHIVEAVLNHKSGVIRGVAAVYNRFDYAKEKREALDAWAKYIISLS